MILLSFAGCRKIDYEKQASATYQNEFSQLEVFKGKQVPEGTFKQLKMRYGTPQNWLRYVNSFKPRHSFRQEGDIADSSASHRQPRKLSNYQAIYTITILDENGSLLGVERVRSDLYLLDQLEEQGWDLPYSSRCGADGTDAVRLISGMVDQSDQTYLSDNQINSGFVLLSVAYALSDCVIKINQEEYLYSDDWYEWSGGGGGTGGYNNNLTTSTYNGVVYTPNDYPGKEANMSWMWWVNPNLSSKFIEAWMLLQDERLEDEYELQLDCYGTRRTGNVEFTGTYEHWIIQLDYVASFMGGVREYSIPYAGSSGNRRGYVDLANIMTKEMFEIKPNSFAGQTAGANEVSHYVTLANTHCPVVPPWRKGTYYPARSLRAGSRSLLSKLDGDGVIVYSWNNDGTRTIPVPSLDVINALKKLLKDFQKIKKEDYDLALLAFLQVNPEVLTHLKIALIGGAIVIVVGTLIEDFVSGGFGTFDDPIHFALAHRLVQTALKL